MRHLFLIFYGLVLGDALARHDHPLAIAMFAGIAALFCIRWWRLYARARERRALMDWQRRRKTMADYTVTGG